MAREIERLSAESTRVDDLNAAEFSRVFDLQQEMFDMEEGPQKEALKIELARVGGEIEERFQRSRALTEQVRNLRATVLQRQREQLYVEDPATFKVKWLSRFSGDRGRKVKEGISEFRRLTGTGTMDPSVTVGVRKAGRQRSYHSVGDIHLSTPRS